MLARPNNNNSVSTEWEARRTPESSKIDLNKEIWYCPSRGAYEKCQIIPIYTVIKKTWPMGIWRDEIILARGGKGRIQGVIIILLGRAHPTACGILVPWMGIEIEPMPPSVEAQSLDYWTTREVPHSFLMKYFWASPKLGTGTGMSKVKLLLPRSAWYWKSWLHQWSW